MGRAGGSAEGLNWKTTEMEAAGSCSRNSYELKCVSYVCKGSWGGNRIRGARMNSGFWPGWLSCT